MKNLKGKVAVVTGVASGIGKALAEELFKEGCHLALNDYDEPGLQATVDSLSPSSDQNIFSKAFDVSDREAFYAFAGEVEAEFGQVDLVINNAGVALGKAPVEELRYQDFEWVMNINFWGMVYGTKAFLPQLKKQKEAAVANVSSVFGFAGIRYQSAYCTSKFAIRGFTESLRMEAVNDFPHVTIHTIHPGGINTNIAKNSRWDHTEMSEKDREELMKMSNEQLISSPTVTAQQIIRHIKKKKERIVVGSRATSMDLITRLFPTRYTRILNNNFKKQGYD